MKVKKTGTLKNIHEMYKVIPNSANLYHCNIVSSNHTCIGVECPLSEGDTFTFSVDPHSSVNYYQICYFNENRVKIEHWNATASKRGRRFRSLTLPANVKYWQICCIGATKTDLRPMIKAGQDYDTAYVPWKAYIGELWKKFNDIPQGNDNLEADGCRKIFDAGWEASKQGIVPMLLEGTRKKPADLKVYGNAQRGDVPDGYTLLESLEGTGTQYIDTELRGSLATAVECCAANMNNAEDTAVCQFFGDNTSGTRAVTAQMAMDSNAITRFGNRTYTGRLAASRDTYYTVQTNKTNFRVDGVVAATFNCSTAFVTDKSMLLFAACGATPVIGKVKMRYCKFWDNNILVADFRPAKRNSDDTLGMYDTVRRRFFENAGTGTFVAGAEITFSVTAPMPLKGVGEAVNLCSEELEIGGLDGTGAEMPHAASIRTPFIPIGGEMAYTSAVINVDTYRQIYRHWYDAGRQWLGYSAMPAGARYVRMSFQRVDGADCAASDLAAIQAMLVKGSTAPPSYVSPRKRAITVKVAGNYFDVTKLTGGYFSGHNAKTGSVTMGSVGNVLRSTAKLSEIAPGLKVGKKYTFFCSSAYNSREYMYDTAFGRSSGVWGSGTAMVITQEMLDITPAFASNAVGMVISNLMIVDGEVALMPDFTPYGESEAAVLANAPLRRVGNTTDEYDSGAGVVTRRIGRITLDGVTTGRKFAGVSALSDFYVSAITVSDILADCALMCSHFANQNTEAINVCYSGADGITFHHQYGNVNDVNAWLHAQWAAGTPVEVWYVLAEAATEQTGQMDVETENIRTVVDVLGEVRPSSVSVEYIKRTI